MPKLTRTGYEIGSSEAGAIVLHKTSFQTRHEVLQKHKLARAGVEAIDEVRNQRALRRGTHLKLGLQLGPMKKSNACQAVMLLCLSLLKPTARKVWVLHQA